ncbi:D-arabinono-1,4-lactone oxidase [Corynebacterium camporealensis]|nr:D-arabinono-1,4-lactone oxidase [Corynebacterium camporealensis]
MTTFQNWAGLVRSTPNQFLQPQNLEELRRIVQSGVNIRPVGAGHSFTPVAAGDDVMVNLDHLSGIVSVDEESKRVRFLAGTRLRDVPALLRPYGLALVNQGDVDPQSLAGAVSTSTHGTGVDYTGFAGTVTALTFFDVSGELRHLNIDEDPETLRLATVSIGTLGIVVEVEMQCVDAFDLQAVESGDDFTDILNTFEERARAVDHFECFWFPGAKRAMTKENTRLPAETPAGQGKVKKFITDEMLGNGAFAGVLQLGRVLPSAIPTLNRAATAAISNNRYRAPAHEVFVTSRRVRFHEMEYAVPLADGPSIVKEIRQLIDNRGWHFGFPIEMRTTAADDVALSTAYGRESMYIAVHVPQFQKPWEFFPDIEAIFRAGGGGRPHWGKMRTLQRDDLAELYPRFDDFCSLREQFDPQWRLRTPYLKRLFA